MPADRPRSQRRPRAPVRRWRATRRATRRAARHCRSRRGRGLAPARVAAAEPARPHARTPPGHPPGRRSGGGTCRAVHTANQAVSRRPGRPARSPAASAPEPADRPPRSTRPRPSGRAPCRGRARQLPRGRRPAATDRAPARSAEALPPARRPPLRPAPPRSTPGAPRRVARPPPNGAPARPLSNQRRGPAPRSGRGRGVRGAPRAPPAGPSRRRLRPGARAGTGTSPQAGRAAARFARWLRVTPRRAGSRARFRPRREAGTGRHAQLRRRRGESSGSHRRGRRVAAAARRAGPGEASPRLGQQLPGAPRRRTDFPATARRSRSPVSPGRAPPRSRRAVARPLPAQRLQHQSRCRPRAQEFRDEASQRAVRLELVTAVGHDQQQPPLTRRMRDERHEIQRGSVGPVHVLEDEDDRHLGAEVLEKGERVSEESKPRFGAAAREGWRRWLRLRQLRNQPRQLRKRAPHRGDSRRSAKRPQRLEEGEIGKAAADEVDTTSAQHGCTRPLCPLRERGHEPGLADAGLTLDQHRGAATVGCRREAHLEAVQRADAPDEARQRLSWLHG